MTFADAVSQLVGGKAAKTPSMSGYVERIDVEPNLADADADADVSAYRLSFVRRPGPTGSDRSTFAFVVTRNRKTFVTTVDVTFDDSTSAMTVSPQFLQMMLSSDWLVADTSELESARSSGSEW